MDIKVTKFTKESTVGMIHNGVPHTGDVVACRFYALNSDGTREKVDVQWDGTFEEAVRKFAERGVIVTIAELEAAFGA